MKFRDLFLAAKKGDEDAILELLRVYKPVLVRYSMIKGVFDEDLYQEQCITLLRCISTFEIYD